MNYAEMANCASFAAPASVGFEQMQTMKVFDYVFKKKESLCLLHPVEPMTFFSDTVRVVF